MNDVHIVQRQIELQYEYATFIEFGHVAATKQ